METKKLILIIILSTSLLFLWDAWQKELQLPPSQLQTTTSSVAGGSTDKQQEGLPVPGDQLVTQQQADIAANTPEIEGVTLSATPRLLLIGETIHVVTDMVVAEIDTAGGDIRRIGLLHHPSREDKDKPFDLLKNQAANISVAQAGLIGENLPSHKTNFTVPSNVYNYELPPGEDKIVVRLLAPEVNGIQVAKIFTFHRGSYLVDIEFEISNKSESALQPFAYFQILRDGNAPAKSSAFVMSSYLGVAMYTEDEKFLKIKFSDLDENKAKYPADADNGWIAMLEHYFVTAWLPEQNTPREYFAKQLVANHYTAGVIVPVDLVQHGQTKSVSMPLYAGPQEQNKLAELSPGLELTVDYGWLTVIAKPLFWLLSFYQSYVGNWGIAIILLTMTVKILFFPLSAAGYRSMARMKIVAPKLQRIREQYGSDKQRMNQAMMDFYKQEKINPIGGCLPVLVQIPVFIALFWTLLAAVELRYTPLALWITDMSAPDPYYILPLIMGVSMWIQSKLNPKPADPIQAKIMQIMPIAFSIFFFFFPAGLVLYSLCNNVLSIAQQWQITRMFEKKASDEKNKDKLKNKPDEDKPLLLASSAIDNKQTSDSKEEETAVVDKTDFDKTDDSSAKEVKVNKTAKATKIKKEPKIKSKKRAKKKKK